MMLRGREEYDPILQLNIAAQNGRIPWNRGLHKGRALHAARLGVNRLAELVLDLGDSDKLNGVWK